MVLTILPASLLLEPELTAMCRSIKGVIRGLYAQATQLSRMRRRLEAPLLRFLGYGNTPFFTPSLREIGKPMPLRAAILYAFWNGGPLWLSKKKHSLAQHNNACLMKACHLDVFSFHSFVWLVQPEIFLLILIMTTKA